MSDPLFERDAALQQLEDLAARADAGSGGVAVVTGEAGIGKTALVRHFADCHPEFRWLRGFAEPDSVARPLGVIHDLALAIRGTLLGAVRDGAPAWRLYEALLEDLAAGQALPVLWIEDAQWSDQATIDALRYLFRRVNALRLLIIVSLRSDDRRTADIRKQMLHSVPIDHWSELKLTRLSESTVALMANSAGLDATTLFRLTKGNPLETVSMMRWGSDSVPESLAQLALQKLADLDVASRTLIQRLCIYPERIDKEWIRQLPEATPATFANCVTQNWLVEQSGHWSFEHELLRQAVLEALDAGQRRLLHRQALTLPLTPVQASYHALHAQDWPRLEKEAAVAAGQAARAGAFREAAAYWQMLLEHTEPAPQLRAHAQDRLSWCLVHAGDIANGRVALERALSGWQAIGDTSGTLHSMSGALRWSVHVRLAAPLFSDDELARALAFPERPTETFDRGILEIERARLAARRLEFDAVRAVLDRIRTRLKAPLEDWQSTELNWWIGWLEAYELCEPPSVDLAALVDRDHRLDLVHFVLSVNRLRALIAMYCFDLAAGAQALDAAMRYTERRDIATEPSIGLAGLMAFQRGRFADATSYLDQAIEALRGFEVRVGYLIPIRQLIAARLGQAVNSGEAHAAFEQMTRSGLTVLVLVGYGHVAELAWLAGDEAAAAHRLEQARGLRARLSDRIMPGLLGPVDWLDALLSDSSRSTLFTAQAEPRVRRQSTLWLERDMPYQAAMVLAGGDARSRRESLKILRGLGAERAIERLQQIWADAGVAEIPRGPYAASRDNPAELTRREMQLLELMSEGLTNAEIAEKLHRSVRTIEHHVSAIIAKTGVKTRRQAVQWMRVRRGGQ